MNEKRNRVLQGLLAGFLAFGLTSGALGFEIAIEVAPNVLNLQSAGFVVSVHTDIAFGEVQAHSVRLNGVEIASWKEDNRGFFVAKFLMDEIKSLEELNVDADNELQLSGLTSGEPQEAFWGRDIIWVIDNLPVKAGR